MDEISDDPLDDFSEEDIRREAKRLRDEHYGLLMALRDLPEAPSPRIMRVLSMAARWPEDNGAGKRYQRDNPGVVPFKSECEGGMGLWLRLRAGLIATDPKLKEPRNG